MIMKNIFRFLAVVSVFAGLVSCVKYADYKTDSFVSLDVSSAKIPEPEEGSTSYSLPVHVYNFDGSCSVSYEVVDISAKQGEDYTVVGGTGVLNFSQGVDTQILEFSIIGRPGMYTGDLKFQVVLKGATENVNLGGLSKCTVTIVDGDFHGDWAWLTGTWVSQDYEYPGTTPDGSEYSVEISQISETECEIFNLWGGGESIKGTVDFVTSTISIPAFQLILDDPDYGPCVMAWGDGGSLSATKPIMCTFNGDGIQIGGPEVGHCYYVYITSGEYAGYGFGMVWSKLRK